MSVFRRFCAQFWSAVPSDPTGGPPHGGIRPRVLYAGGAGLLAVTLLAAGCTTGQPPSAGDASPSPSATTSVPDGGPTGTATRPPDPVATDVPSVKRAVDTGTREAPTPVGYDGSSTYHDGVVVTVTGVRQLTGADLGPGSYAGAPVTAVTVKLVNGSGAPVDLDSVVASMTYGDPAHAAPPAYEPGAADFSGSVAPGASAGATYMFLVPTDQLADTRLTLDLDATHGAAVFSGRLA